MRTRSSFPDVIRRLWIAWCTREVARTAPCVISWIDMPCVMSWIAWWRLASCHELLGVLDSLFNFCTCVGFIRSPRIRNMLLWILRALICDIKKLQFLNGTIQLPQLTCGGIRPCGDIRPEKDARLDRTKERACYLTTKPKWPDFQYRMRIFFYFF